MVHGIPVRNAIQMPPVIPFLVALLVTHIIKLTWIGPMEKKAVIHMIVQNVFVVIQEEMQNKTKI